MSRRDDRVSLQHMLDHAREAMALAAARTREDLTSDRVFYLAMTRLLEILGEAAGRVTAQTRERFPAIPWIEIIGLRNRLIHGYDQVDCDVLWSIVQHDLTPLIDQLEAAIQGDERT
jgi:uncharacterized protein with HEPN domain